MPAFSIGSWSFHGMFHAGKMNLYGYLESVKYRYHLQHADIWSGMLHSTEEEEVRKIQDTLEEEGLIVACLAVDGADVWHDDPDIRQQRRQKALRYLAIARKWGAQTVRIDMGIPTATLSEEQHEHSVRTYREYAQYAKDYGFSVGPQTHQPGSQVPQNLVRLHQDIGSPSFGIILNVNRWMADEARGDELVAPFTIHAQLDRAFVDFTGPQLLQKVDLLHHNGYQGCWSLEFRGGKNEYQETARDLLDLRLAVKQANVASIPTR